MSDELKAYSDSREPQEVLRTLRATIMGLETENLQLRKRIAAHEDAPVATLIEMDFEGERTSLKFELPHGTRFSAGEYYIKAVRDTLSEGE